MKPLVILSVIILSVPSFSPLAFGTVIPTASVVLELFPIHEEFLVYPLPLRGTGNQLVVTSSRIDSLTSVPSLIYQLPFLLYSFAVKRTSSHYGANTYAGCMDPASILESMSSLGHLNSSNSGCIYGIYMQGSYANSPPDSIAFQVIATPTK